jgi:YqaJ-like viral recombinase domain
MIHHEVTQGEDAWKKLRLGIITASNMDCIISPTGQESKQVEKYIHKLLSEQITGESSDTFEGNFNTERGKEYEQEAADYYSMVNSVELQKVGFCTTNDGRLGCSPDRFVGDDGILEIKTALPHIMVQYYLSGKLEQDHRPQTQSTLYIAERQWADTMLYNPMFKPIIIRSNRNGVFITDMLGFTDKALKMLDEKKKKLREQGCFYEPTEAAQAINPSVILAG